MTKKEGRVKKDKNSRLRLISQAIDLIQQAKYTSYRNNISLEQIQQCT